MGLLLCGGVVAFSLPSASALQDAHNRHTKLGLFELWSIVVGVSTKMKAEFKAIGGRRTVKRSRGRYTIFIAN